MSIHWSVGGYNGVIGRIEVVSRFLRHDNKTVIVCRADDFSGRWCIRAGDCRLPSEYLTKVYDNEEQLKTDVSAWADYNQDILNQ